MDADTLLTHAKEHVREAASHFTNAEDDFAPTLLLVKQHDEREIIGLDPQWLSTASSRQNLYTLVIPDVFRRLDVKAYAHYFPTWVDAEGQAAAKPLEVDTTELREAVVLQSDDGERTASSGAYINRGSLLMPPLVGPWIEMPPLLHAPYSNRLRDALV